MAKPPADPAKADYQALQAELDTIMLGLQRDDLDVDAVIKQYERGLEIVQQLEAYLQHAENRVREIKARFDAEDTSA